MKKFTKESNVGEIVKAIVAFEKRHGMLWKKSPFDVVNGWNALCNLEKGCTILIPETDEEILHLQVKENTLCSDNPYTCWGLVLGHWVLLGDALGLKSTTYFGFSGSCNVVFGPYGSEEAAKEAAKEYAVNVVERWIVHETSMGESDGDWSLFQQDLDKVSSGTWTLEERGGEMYVVTK